MGTLLLAVTVVLYELFKLANIKGYGELLTLIRNSKDNKDLYAEKMLKNQKFMLFTVLEFIYVILMVVLIFTPLVHLGIYMAVASMVMMIIPKVFKKEYTSIRVIDSVLTIIVTVVVYHSIS